MMVGMRDFNCEDNNGTANFTERGTINAVNVVLKQDNQNIDVENEKRSNIEELVEIECEVKFKEIIGNKNNLMRSIQESEKVKNIIEAQDMNTYSANVAIKFWIEEYIVGLANRYINEENKIRENYSVCYTKKRLESIQNQFRMFLDDEWSNFVSCSYDIADKHIAYNRGETYDYKKREIMERIEQKESYYREQSLELIHDMLNVAFINVNKALLEKCRKG